MLAQKIDSLKNRHHPYPLPTTLQTRVVSSIARENRTRVQVTGKESLDIPSPLLHGPFSYCTAGRDAKEEELAEAGASSGR